MKLSTWGRSHVKTLSEYFQLIVICIGTDVFAMGPAVVTVTNYDEFHIRKSDDNSEVGTFKMTVYEQPKKCTDGSLQLRLKIETNFREKIKYDNKEIEDSENGKIFSVTIHKDDLKNEIFYKTISLETGGSTYKFDNIKLRIEPCVEINADVREVDFGKISWDGHRLHAENSPSVRITYGVLKDALCEVKSSNDFRIKHEDKDEFIPYSMNEMTTNGDIKLTADFSEYIAKFQIRSTGIGHTPLAGNYRDKITFTIKPYQ